ncbi:pentapeptide repeat-containing protein [Paracoccus sp. NFXS7]|uniref:pentapeptide repeat-containing protein n=1 Tax=Paracoccus sp. NFXS7 TaxID=2908653 RepID=UPI0032DEAF77
MDKIRKPQIEDGIAYFEIKKFVDCSISHSERRDFRHALLSRVSGKGATLSNFDFRYAELTDCYFHGAKFDKCDFTGVKIRRCNFRTATFEDCTFDYITIEETPVDYKQVVKNLPDRPNVAQEILHALRRNAVTQGEQKAVRELTLLEVDQEREHLRRALKGRGEYYRKKYGTLSQKLKLRARAIGLWLSHYVWGHGEKISRLLTTCLISVLLLSLISVTADAFSNPGLSVLDAGSVLMSYVTGNFIDLLGVDSDILPARPVSVTATVAVMRIIFGGMFAAYIFRAISRR